MILERLEAHNYGPFAIPATLELDPEVTVLTGPNDVGKSSLLRLVARLYNADGLPAVGVTEFNQDNLHTAQVDWQQREAFGAVARFRMTSPHPKWSELGGPHAILVKLGVAPNNYRRRAVELFDENNRRVHNRRWDMPEGVIRAVLLPPATEVRDTIDFSKPTSAESNIFKIVLGNEFKFTQMSSLSPILFDGQLGRAEGRLNECLRSFLPASLGISWALRASSDLKGIHCYLRDDKGGYTALGLRGAGVRRVMAVFAGLMSHDSTDGNWMVLFDEPELSLHADSQHLLRRVLEGLGEKPNVQVVYSTHSPSMINVARPHAIRLPALSATSSVSIGEIEQAFRGAADCHLGQARPESRVDLLGQEFPPPRSPLV
ncbi:AAA family ATPase, partial [bacterium]|nr:AAA family ATPase [bacterium]